MTLLLFLFLSVETQKSPGFTLTISLIPTACHDEISRKGTRGKVVSHVIMNRVALGFSLSRERMMRPVPSNEDEDEEEEVDHTSHTTVSI
jgi:hypothetical protein